MWCRIARSDTRPPRGSLGFTLIEVLVAIAVLAVVLGAIGAVVGNTVRTIRSVDRRLPLLETAQSLIASLPTRDALQPGTQSGTSGEFRWRIDAPAEFARGAGLRSRLQRVARRQRRDQALRGFQKRQAPVDGADSSYSVADHGADGAEHYGKHRDRDQDLDQREA